MGINVTTAPTEEPVTLAQAKVHLGLFSSDDDSMVTSLIKAARQSVEMYTGRAICTQTVTLTLDSFPAVISLPRLPVQSITSISYIDENGDNQSFTTFKADLTGSVHARINPSYGEVFPATRAETGAVTIVYVCGWGNPTASPDPVPFPVKQAVLLLTSSMYNNRENEIIGTITSTLPINVKWLLSPYRLNQT